MSTKRPKNLLLDWQTTVDAEAYAKANDTTLSRLVEDYLKTLPKFAERVYDVQSTIVAELYGAAVVNPEDAQRQRELLERWRRRRGKE